MSTIYKDKLIEVTDQEIVFHRYYFPFGGDKHVPLQQIERVEARRPSFFGGSWRIWAPATFGLGFRWMAAGQAATGYFSLPYVTVLGASDSRSRIPRQ
jgi:hypothetical protein